MTLLLYIIIILAAAKLLLPLWVEVAKMAGHLEKNYRGQAIPQSMGAVFPPVLLLALGWARWAGLLPEELVVRTIIVALGLGVLGLLDDIWGNSASKGFGGHFRRLLFNGEVTTGLLKAVIGFLVAMWAVAGLPGFFLLMFWRAAIVALSANLVNLLDLRPGRSMKGFFLLSLIYVVWVRSEVGILLLFPLLLLSLVYFPWDLAGKGMLGDAGANVLGGVLGLVIVLTAAGIIQTLYLLLLLVTHLFAEKISLTQLIAANPLLRFLDNLGREQWEK